MALCASILKQTSMTMKPYHNTMHIIWELFLLGTITFTCIVSPLRVSMLDSCDQESTDEKTESITADQVIKGIEIAFDCLFLADLAFNRLRMHTSTFWMELSNSFIKIDESIWSIYSQFFNMKMLIGFLSFLPLVMLSGKNDCSIVLSSIGFLRGFRVVAIPRQFIQIGELFFSENNSRLNIPHLRLALIIYIFLLTVSFSGCFYFYVSCPPNNDYCMKAWRATRRTNTQVEDENIYHWATVDEQMSSSWESHFIRSIYFSMQTMFSIGYVLFFNMWPYIICFSNRLVCLSPFHSIFYLLYLLSVYLSFF